MAHRMDVILTDEEYTILSVEAAKRGQSLENFLHEVLAQHLQPSTPEKRSFTRHDIQEYLYREGIIEHIPTDEPDVPEEETERKRLAHLFGQGELASDMVIEDRGPR